MKKKVFITGMTGMVGSHLLDYLINNTNWEIHGLVRWRSSLEARSILRVAGEVASRSDGMCPARRVDAARAFRDEQGENATVVIKAVAGGGGRGMRIVAPGDDLAASFERCRAEAQAAFGNEDPAIYRRRKNQKNFDRGRCRFRGNKNQQHCLESL